MTYGVAITMPAPVAFYDQLHHELLGTFGSGVDGLILHIGRPVEAGFQVIEIWDSQEQSDYYNHEVVWPIITRVLTDRQPLGEPVQEEFEVRGLVVPNGNIVY